MNDATPRPLAEIEARVAALGRAPEPDAAAAELLGLGEEVLAHWILARGETPTRETREGFRLLALHRQGAKGDPSFNACRETCRELVYHHNLIKLAPAHPDVRQRLAMAALVATHLHLFVSGKMEVAQLGEFCCSSRPLRAQPADESEAPQAAE
jgi:hypothetical protein